MLFFTCDHYNISDNFLNLNNKINDINDNISNHNISNDITVNNNECFICLEIYNNFDYAVRLKSVDKYFKICSCDGWIHIN